MTAGVIFFLLFALFFKHIIIDFPIYSGYTCRRWPKIFTLLWNLHVILHGVGALVIFLLIGLPFLPSVILALFDSISHLIIDATVTYTVRRNKTDAVFESKFYWVPELDQFLHCLVYVIMVFSMAIIVSA